MASLFATLIQYILISSLLQLISSCAYRKYNRDSYVCVCNEFYCDSLHEIERPDLATVHVYESNRDGLRFHKTVLEVIPLIETWSTNFDQLYITLKPDIKLQPIVGFGVAFNDAGALNIMSLSSRMADSVIRDYFGSDGLELNLAKVPIGSTEQSRREYSLASPMDLNLSTFNLAEEDLWYKIPLIEKAKIVRPELKVIASASSPPSWMTSSRVGSTTKAPLKSTPGSNFYKLWAKYQLRFLKAYRSYGIDFWGLIIACKPFSSSLPNGPDGLPMSPFDERDYIRYDLGPLSRREGYTKESLKIFFMDDIASLAPLWSSYVLADREAARYVSGMAFTRYWNNMLISRLVLDLVHDRWPQQLLLSSEAASSPDNQEKVSLGNWQRAESFGVDIIEDLNHWTSAFIYSNLASDLIGGPSKANRFSDSHIIVNALLNEYFKQPSYYLLAHFSKFLASESLRIDNSLFKTVDNVYTFTALNGHDLAVIIVLNTNEFPLDVRINGFARGFVRSRISSRSIQTYIGRV